MSEREFWTALGRMWWQGLATAGMFDGVRRAVRRFRDGRRRGRRDLTDREMDLLVESLVDAALGDSSFLAGVCRAHADRFTRGDYEDWAGEVDDA